MCGQHRGTLIYLERYTDVSAFDVSLNPRPRYSAWTISKSVREPPQKPPTLNKSDQTLLDCIDKVLTDVLGMKVREAIYDRLARQSYLSTEEIPSHLQELSRLLENLFGTGATTLEKRIAREFYHTLGLEFAGLHGHGLEEQLTLAKNIMNRGQESPRKLSYNH